MKTIRSLPTTTLERYSCNTPPHNPINFFGHLCLWLYPYVHHHHHHVPEGLGVFPVPWTSRWSWSLHLFLGRPLFLRHFGLYCSACFGSLFVSILCTCFSYFFWYCFISFTMFCTPVFCLMYNSLHKTRFYATEQISTYCWKYIMILTEVIVEHTSPRLEKSHEKIVN